MLRRRHGSPWSQFRRLGVDRNLRLGQESNPATRSLVCMSNDRTHLYLSLYLVLNDTRLVIFPFDWKFYVLIFLRSKMGKLVLKPAVSSCRCTVYATGWTLQSSSPGTVRGFFSLFRNVLAGCGALSTSYSVGTVAWSSGVTPPHHLYALMAWTIAAVSLRFLASRLAGWDLIWNEFKICTVLEQMFCLDLNWIYERSTPALRAVLKDSSQKKETLMFS